MALTAVPAMGAAQAPTAKGKLYRWVDSKGEVHYSDRCRPNTPRVTAADEQRRREGRLRARRGHPRKSASEIAACDAEAEALQSSKAEVQRRDRMLLETYLSVADIEDLRDRRVELLESQIKVTELYLANLRKRLGPAAGSEPVTNHTRSRPRSAGDSGELRNRTSRTTASIASFTNKPCRARA